MAFGITAGQLLGAAAGLGGALLGSKGSKGTTTNNAPWKQQQPYLTYGFQGGQDALNKALAAGTYGGPRIAGLNDYQIGGANAAGDYALGTGLGLGSAQAGMGLGGLSNLYNYTNNAGSLLNNYVNGDPTGYALNMANTYASSPYADGMVSAASRDISRNLYENQLPNLSLSAAGSGNTNSTRAGIAEGIMQRGAADRIGDLSAQIRGGLFNTGLNNGLNQYNTQFTNSLNANNAFLNASQLGQNALNSGLQNVYNSADAAVRAGQMYQNQNQNELTSNMNAFNEARDTPMSLWQKYMNLVGGQQFGSTQTSSTPGGITGALGGAASGLGLFNAFAKLGQQPNGYNQQQSLQNWSNSQQGYMDPGYSGP